VLNFWLTGAKACEFSNATTTQMFNPTDGRWATNLLAKLDIPTIIFPEIVQPGTRLGAYEGIPVIAPACHDTGSAVAAVPAATRNASERRTFAYISSGTWSLVGLEVDEPILTPEALAANVTNEGGVYGTYRLLKNVMGLWILQQCRATWAAAGEEYSYAELVAMAEVAEPLTAVFNPNDPAFLAPGDHPQHIRDMCQRINQPEPPTVGAMVRCVLESLALAYREVLEQVTAVANHPVSTIHIVGGGTQNELLNQMTADATGLPVVTGRFEAIFLGIALVQLITLGDFGYLSQARLVVGGLAEFKIYAQKDTAVWDEAYGRYKAIID
jgi:rhamnulokinase